MEELAMCRVCLAEDVRLCLIVNTHLQEMYESLTSLPLETKDSRPIRACYICCAGLQNCYRLRKRCHRSEELFTQILSSVKLQPLHLQDVCTPRLRVEHPVIHLSISDELQNNTDDDTTEDSAHRTEVPDIIDHDTMKKEDNEALTDIKMEPQEEHDTQTDADIQFLHLEDPLDVMKREPDNVDTDAVDIKLEINIEENEPNGAHQSSLSEYNICSNIVNIELERIDLNDTMPATGVPALKKLAETDSLLVTEPENVNKSIVIDKLIAKRKIRKIDATLHKHRDNKVTAREEVHEQHDLTRNMYTHTDNKPYITEISKKQFSQESQLTVHLPAHTSGKPFKCETCNKTFTKKSYLTQHLQTHASEKLFQCDICKMLFKFQSSLTRHLSKHANEKRFQCDVCNKCFTSKYNLMRHLYTHTGEKRFQCSMCNKCFTGKFNLMQHLYLHTNERRFQCDVCNKRFTHKSNLTQHQHTHASEKRFQCDTCAKYFKNKSYLKQHLYIHSIKKQIPCDVCNKTFSRKGDLAQHITFTHTGEKPFQ